MRAGVCRRNRPTGRAVRVYNGRRAGGFTREREGEREVHVRQLLRHDGGRESERIYLMRVQHRLLFDTVTSSEITKKQ